MTVYKIDLLARLLLSCVLCCYGQSGTPLSLAVSQGGQRIDLSFESSDPNTTATLRNVTVAPDQQYSITCSRSGGLNRNTPVWFRNNSQVSLDSSQTVRASVTNNNNWVLEFSSFSAAEDVGRYSCRSEGDSLSLDITTANPAVIPDKPYLTLNEDSPTVLLTPFVSGDPAPLLTEDGWLFNGVLPPESTRFGNAYFLRPPLNSRHSGTYTYTVNTTAGTASAEFIVFVIIRPAPLIQPFENQQVAEGESINITCSDSIGIPPPTFTWQFNNREIQSNDNRIITDSSNATHQFTNLYINSISVEDIGEFSCVARNNPNREIYGGQDLQVSLLGPPSPPLNITAIPTSPCTAEISWRVPSPSDGVLAAVNYIIEIQLITNGSAEQWKELGRAGTPPLLVSIPFRGLNTTYHLRGRGRGRNLRDGNNSMSYGPFLSYQDGNLPTVNLMGRTGGADSILLSWSVADSMCYTFEAVSVECAGSSAVPVVTGQTSQTVTGLQPDTEHSCRVFGTFVEGEQNPVINASTSASTLPRAPSLPSIPKLDESSVKVDQFTIILEGLPAMESISHYHILVLRLSSPNAVPSGSPDDLYTSIANFSTCEEVNVAASDKDVTYRPYIAAELSAADFMSKFVVGDPEALDPDAGGLDHCNSKLVSRAAYTVFFRAYPVCRTCEGDRIKRQMSGLPRQYTVFSSSGFLPVVVTAMPKFTDGTLRPSSNSTAVIVSSVVVILAVLALVFVVVFVVCCCCKMRTRKLTFSPSVDHSIGSSSSDLAHYPDTPDIGRNGIELKAMEAFADPMEIPFQPSGPIRKEEFAKHVEKFDAKRQLLFTEEFEWIGKKSPWHPAEASNHPENDHKNRYSNITAFDHSAVKLKPIPGVEHSDYINANYISGYNKAREYIATQGPLDQTVEDFWRMVWEQQTNTIIMLTNLVELGKIKCSQYWPNSSKTMYGSIAVTLESTHVFPDYTIRTLGVQSAKTNEQRRVLQFHYTKWPDYGTPKLAAPLLNFLKIVHESNDSEETAGPMVVHCSAGVGRSGTVLTIDYCLQQLRKEGVADVCTFVCNMREQRSYMVQTDQQYTFIHYAILEAITYGDTSYDVEGFMKSYSKLQSSSPTSSPSKLLLEEEFERLGAVKTMVKKSSFQNRIKMKGAPQRHFHSSFHGGSASGSFQQCLGHFLDGYNQSNMFILTEGPEDLSAQRFWEIIWDNHCSSIIMLAPVDTEDLFCYWPEGNTTEVQFGPIKVMVESESQEHLYTSRKIRLVNAKVDGISHELVQYQFRGWTEQYLPRVPDFVSFVCDVIKKLDTPVDSKSKVLVHDLASLGPAGIFCSLFYSIQRLQLEKVVDVFQAVQMIQLQRPGCVSQVEEYAFIYDCVYEFLVKNS